jgi:YfiR/HmsC-like
MIVYTLCIAATAPKSFSLSKASQVGDYKIHCLYLYKFSQLIKWPETTTEFTIGVVGISPIVPVLEQYFASKNKSSTIKYKVIRITAAQVSSSYNLIFVTKEQVATFDQISKNMAGKPSLLVTEVPGLIKRGACINLISEEGSSIKVQINKSSIESHNLKPSKELLKLGTEII